MIKDELDLKGLDRSFFKQRLKTAIEDGILIFVKYSVILILIYMAIAFGSNVIAGSANGTQAIIYLNELQKKGYLPQVVNGQIPEKLDVKKDSSSIKP